MSQLFANCELAPKLRMESWTVLLPGVLANIWKQGVAIVTCPFFFCWGNDDCSCNHFNMENGVMASLISRHLMHQYFGCMMFAKSCSQKDWPKGAQKQGYYIARSPPTGYYNQWWPGHKLSWCYICANRGTCITGAKISHQCQKLEIPISAVGLAKFVWSRYINVLSGL